jgi:hypothetical protein
MTTVSVTMMTHGQETEPFWGQIKRGADKAASDFNVDLKYEGTADPNAQAKPRSRPASASIRTRRSTPDPAW